MDNNQKIIPLEKAKKLFSFNWFVATPQRKSYTILGVSIITFALLMWLAVRPTIITIIEINKKIGEFKETAQELDIKYQNLLRLTDQYEKPLAEGGYREAIDFFQKYVLPNKDSVLTLIGNINKYSEQAAINLKSITQEESKEEGNIKYLTFKLSIEGSLENIKRFIKMLEDFPRPLSLESINISVNEKDKTVYTADITFVTYTYSTESI